MSTILAVVQRPHLAHRLIADARDDAADVVQHRVGRAALVPPILLGVRQLVADGVRLAFGVRVAHHRTSGRLVRHIVDAGADIDQWLEHGMRDNVVHSFAIQINFAAISNGLAVFIAGADHNSTLEIGAAEKRRKIK